MPALSVDLEIEINAPPEKVWDVFSSAENMMQWMRLSGYQPQVGSTYQMDVSAPDGDFIFTGEVTIYDPPRQLAFTWLQQEVGQDPWPTDTLVSLFLTPTAAGTHVRLTHTGFEKLADPQAERDSHVEGWVRSQALEELKTLVESN